MQTYLTIVSILLLMIIAYQDFRYRAVSWLIVVVWGALIAWQSISGSGWEIWLRESMVNIGFFAVQYGALTLYFSLKERRLVHLADVYIGWGDILFIGIMCFGFSLPGFVALYLGGLMVVLFVFLIYRMLFTKASHQIPLAGGLALLLTIVQIFQPDFKSLILQFS
ncbi:MAG: hypothetical protein KDD36_01460 [Flavobacteriales bacterium]|nr:hypothetical protein [Flavobacteriales bacterium]